MDAHDHVQWLLPHIEAGTAPSLEEVEARVAGDFARDWHQGLGNFNGRVAPITVIEVTVTNDRYADAVFTANDGVVWTMTIETDGSGLVSQPTVRVGLPIPGLDLQGSLPTAALDQDTRAEIHGLFGATYRDADHAYLDKQIALLARIAVARVDGTLIGFGLSDARTIDLPRLPSQFAIMGGLCCVAADFRGRRLFGRLENAAAEDLVLAATRDRTLCFGRMAHPVSMRALSGVPSAVPKLGVVPTPWQQEVGAVLAALYDVTEFDAETFVCRGSGRPIGYPDVHVAEDDPLLPMFAPVDRDRGDSLLSMYWNPDAPAGW